MVAPAAVATTGLLSQINNSKLFAGIIMILLNIGSKYINLGLTKSQEEYLRHSFLRYLLIFAICWMGSRDIFIALILTAILSISLDFFLNEDSKFCIIPNKYRKFEEVFDLDGDGVLSANEIKKAEEVINKAKEKERHRNMIMHLNYIKSSN